MSGRCFGEDDELLRRYHDEEWGRPVTSEAGLYELICLEGFQAGLSWTLVLRRREALRAALAGFDADAVAAFDEQAVTAALAAAGMIRHRGKIEAAVANAGATIALRTTGQPLARLVWSYRPASRPAWPRGEVPATVPEAAGCARALKRAGFRFVGPTTCYALFQAAGVVNDHVSDCPWRQEVERAAAAAELPL